MTKITQVYFPTLSNRLYSVGYRSWDADGTQTHTVTDIKQYVEDGIQYIDVAFDDGKVKQHTGFPNIITSEEQDGTVG